MTDDEKRQVLRDLDAIYDAVWGVDIPSPTVPEYIEHHNQMQAIMSLIIKIRRKYDRHS